MGPTYQILSTLPSSHGSYRCKRVRKGGSPRVPVLLFLDTQGKEIILNPVEKLRFSSGGAAADTAADAVADREKRDLLLIKFNLC